ncbi:low choriolytic enzyme-like [Boleophthalmus pectinirostris]|uniref:low choriolytic enzyme-like n=1 Tax=Boleophthalmus pectinirostris TaxID=150288 RepID=UPI000A1C5534|nr:low choriolytic enzyme-like [Boleophthalmus pectinirostris]
MPNEHYRQAPSSQPGHCLPTFNKLANGSHHPMMPQQPMMGQHHWVCCAHCNAPRLEQRLFQLPGNSGLVWLSRAASEETDGVSKQIRLWNKKRQRMDFHLIALALMMSLMVGTLAQDGTNLLDSAQTNSPQASDGESISETIAKANQKIKSRLMQGDIVVDKVRNTVSCSICKWPKSGSKVNIYVRFDPTYSSSQKSLILSAMKTIEDRTCIRFSEISEASTQHLYIFSGDGCFSAIGRQTSKFAQRVSLSKYGCLTRAIIQHEILHALGFAHEHSRIDRDNHLIVLYDNIIPSEKHNFNKYETNNMYTPYDFNSVMHYHNYELSKNGKPTLLSKRNPAMRFGYATGVSYYDILRVNLYYAC